MIFEIVLPALETEFTTGGDVFRQIIDVERSTGIELILIDRIVIDLGLRLDEPGIIRQHGTMEEGKLGIVFKDPRAMDPVGVRKQDQLMAT